MKVFATDLDGCLAISGHKIEKAISEKFNVGVRDSDALTWSEKFNIDTDEIREFLIGELWVNPAFIMDIDPHPENIEEMTRWVLEGLVPAIVTARQRVVRTVTEAWLARHGVPYASLLVSAGGVKGGLLHHLDADFFVEDSPYEAMQARQALVDLEQEARVYVLRRPYNAHAEGSDDFDSEIIWVDDYKEIGRLEGI